MQLHRTDSGVAFLRTEDAAFEGLPDYAFAPRYLEVDGLRLHFIDVGPREAPVALLMHGMPTWSFLNRHIIAALVAQGWRCIAADHIGFGKSDKPVDEAWYSIARHTANHRCLIEALDLRRVTLFAQDWGGPTGLAQAAAMPERFERLVIMNTWLHHDAYAYTPALRKWNTQWKPDGLLATAIPEKLPLGEFMAVALGYVQGRDIMARIAQATPLPLTEAQAAVCAGYDAPFAALGRDGLAGPRRFPLSLPFDNPEGGDAAAQARNFETLLRWRKPVHFIWGAKDEVFTEAWGREWAARYPQATFDVLPDAGHFPQETHGDEIARLVLDRCK